MQVYRIHLTRTIRSHNHTSKSSTNVTQYASAKYIDIRSNFQQEIVAFNYRQALLHCQLFYPQWTPVCIEYVKEHT